jgi:PAS domain S-box-containing protein
MTASYEALQEENSTLRQYVSNLESQLNQLLQTQENEQGRSSSNSSGLFRHASDHNSSYLFSNTQHDTAEHGIPYQALFEALPTALILYDVHGECIAMNEAAATLLNIPKDEFVGVYNVCRDQEAQNKGYTAAFRHARDGSPVTMEQTSFDMTKTGLKGTKGLKDSRVLWLETTFLPIYGDYDAYNTQNTQYAQDIPQFVLEIDIEVTNQREIERDLRSFYALAEHAPDGICIASVDGTLLYTNPSLRRMLNYTTFPPETAFFDIHDEPQDKMNECIEQAITKGSWSGPLTYRHQDGNRFEGQLSLVHIPKENGSHCCIAAIIRNLTHEQQQLQEQLRQNQRLLEEILSHSQAAIFIKDRSFRMLLLNEHCAEVLGKPRKEIEKHREDDIFPKECTQRWRYHDEFVFATGKAITVEEIIPYQGTDHTFLVVKFPLYNEEGEVYAVGGVASDITERKQMEEALRRSEQRFAKVFHASPIPICVTRVKDGHILDVNQGFLSFIGSKREEIVGKTTVELGIWNRASHSRDVVVSLLEQHQTIRALQDEFHLPSGKHRDVLVWMELITLENETCILTMIHDVTEQQRIQAALNHRLQVEQTLAEITTWFMQARYFGDVVNQTLAEVGQLCGADRAFIFFLCEDDTRMTNTYEWCAEGVKPQMHLLQNITTNVFPWWREMRAGKMVEVEDTATLASFMQSTRVFFEQQHTKSFILFPIHAGYRLVGIVGFANTTVMGPWPEENIRVLKVVSHIIGEAFFRREAEETLRINEERYRRLVETSPDSIGLKDLDGTYVVCNQRTAEMLGYDHPDDLVGQNIFDFIAPEHRDIARQAILTTLKRGSTRNHRYELVRQDDGGRIMVEVNTSVIRDAQGNPSSFISIMRDISERVRYEREREALVTVAAALRSASSRSEMVPILLDQIDSLLTPDGVALFIQEKQQQDIVLERGYGVWASLTGSMFLAEKGIIGHVLTRGEPFLTNDVHDPFLIEQPELFRFLRAAACVPMMTRDQSVGVLLIGGQYTITHEDMRLLNAIADMASSALHRTMLHEQTEQRLQQVQALRAVDQAITASNFDINFTLTVLLDQVISELRADAADVLLFNSVTLELEYTAGRGFRSQAIKRTRVRPGEGCAGQVAMERQFVSIEDIHSCQGFCTRSSVVLEDGFRSYYGVPLIARGQLKGVLEVFCHRPTSLDQEWIDFFHAMAGQAAIAIDNAELIAHLQRSNDELILSYDATIEGWARALELRDAETEGHSRRVTNITLILARAMGFNEDDLVHIRRGAVLHDVGKMAIPDNILLKQGPLTEEERAVMRQHTVYAHTWLAPIPFLRPALDIPYCHHERWDGQGYPRGLKGNEIPLAARIFAVVDVWDALRSNRSYRSAWSREESLNYIHQHRSTHFDPMVVDVFTRLLEQEEF